MVYFCAGIAILSTLANSVLFLILGNRFDRLESAVRSMAWKVTGEPLYQDEEREPGRASWKPRRKSADTPPLEVGTLWGREEEEPTEPEWKPGQPMRMDEIDGDAKK